MYKSTTIGFTQYLRQSLVLFSDRMFLSYIQDKQLRKQIRKIYTINMSSSVHNVQVY